MRGSIQKRGTSSWRVRAYVGVNEETGTKRTVSRTVRGTKREAEEVLHRLLLEVGDGRYVSSSSLTVGDLLDQWWPIKRPTLSPSTARDWDSCLRLHVRPHVDGVAMHRFRAIEMDRLYAKLAKNRVGAPRIRRVHTILSTAFAQAVRWQMIAVNPALSASPPELRGREVRPPDPDKLTSFFKTVEEDDPDLAMFAWLAAFTGARRGELCALRWPDVDFVGASLLLSRAIVDGGGVLVEKDTKTHQMRRIALGDETLARLRTYQVLLQVRASECRTKLASDAFVFSFEVDGSRPWRPDTTTHRFIKARRRAGFSDAVRLHDLRHFLATRMISSGVDVRTVSGRLGHRRTSTTVDRYAAFVPASDREAAGLLEASVLNSGPASSATTN
jgi:integrase